MTEVTIVLKDDNGMTTMITDKTGGFIDEIIAVMARGLIAHTFPTTLVKDYINYDEANTGEVFKIGE